MVAAPGTPDLSPNCRLVPIVRSELGAPVQFCAVVQTAPEGKGPSQLILLNSILGGRVYLGALTDRGGRVREWLELWVQVVSGLPGSTSAREDTLSNSGLDMRWREMTDALFAADRQAWWETGWEAAHVAPVWVDPRETRPVSPLDSGSGDGYFLCTDDAVLIAAGLDPYSESLHRYIGVRNHPEAGLIAVTADAPKPGNGRELSDVLPGGKELVPFNPEGGLMFVRRLAPLE